MADNRKRQLEDSDPFGRKSSVPESARGLTLANLADYMQDDAPEVQVVERVEYVEVIPPNTLMAQTDGSVMLYGQQLPRTGIDFTAAEFTQDEWWAMGNTLFAFEGVLQWFIGDWIVYGKHRFGCDIEAIAKHYDRDPHTLENWASVCRKLPFSRRRDLLDFGHHEAVSALDKDTQDYWLARAVQGEAEGEEWRRWSVRKLRTAIDKARKVAKDTPPPAVPVATKKAFTRLAKKPTAADIAIMRQWLDDLERNL